jgi:hypothetical protein
VLLTSCSLVVRPQVHLARKDAAAFRDTVQAMEEAQVSVTAITYCQRLRACTLEPTHAAAKAEAGRLWADMLKRRVPLTTDCFNAMLDVRLREDRECKKHALEALADMRARGLLVRTDTFNTIMAASVANVDFLQVHSPSGAQLVHNGWLLMSIALLAGWPVARPDRTVCVTP